MITMVINIYAILLTICHYKDIVLLFSLLCVTVYSIKTTITKLKEKLEYQEHQHKRQVLKFLKISILTLSMID